MSDPFWFNRIDVLFEKQNLTQFWPSKFQTYEERINALTRFILYSGIVMSAYKHDTSPLVMSLLLISVLVIISRSKNKILKKIVNIENCQKPSVGNPLGNYMPYEDPFRKPACKSDTVENEITSNLFAEFPSKGLSNTNKEFLERQFFSMPNTDLVNDQKGFASWLYGDPNRKMCKSDPSACTGMQGMQNGNSRPGY